MTLVRERFTGRIAGIGSTSGVRIVVGRWDESPWGAFADVMVEDASGHRVLLAPSERVRDFVAATYAFDEHVLGPVTVIDTDDGWSVTAPGLSLRLGTGGRTTLGVLLAAVPDRVATSPAWCSVVDPVARVVLRGVRTRGTAGNDRREWYGATSVVAVTATTDVAPYHSRRSLPAVPRVRTPRSTTRATGSTTEHHAGDVASRSGTTARTPPRGVRPPVTSRSVRA